ncbi:MAG: hypothetical protein WEB85_08000 [Dongiaceae bacterium]
MEWLAKAFGAVLGTLARFITLDDLKRAWRRVQARFLPPGPGMHFTILAAGLTRPYDGGPRPSWCAQASAE